MTLRMRWPKSNKLFLQIYNLKRNLTLLLVFGVYLFLILYIKRNLVFWGF